MNLVPIERRSREIVKGQIRHSACLPFLVIIAFVLTIQLADQAEAQATHPDTVRVPGISTEGKYVRVVKAQYKSPMGAMMRSALFPGWGQAYTGHYVKSGLIFCIESGLIASAIAQDRKAKDMYPTDYQAYLDRIDKRNTLIWWTAGVLVYSMLDAYVDAHLFHFDEDEVSLGLESTTRGEVRLALRVPFPDFR
jgi:hypothetical protein